MPQDPYLSVIVPAYNEAASIARSLAAMRTFLDAQTYTYQVILASDGDDSSPDIARAIARGWPNLELSLAAGRHGKGHGLRRGAAMARGQVVGFLDADYKTPIDECVKLLPWLSDGHDVVIGSRAASGSSIQRPQRWYRRIGSRGFGIVMHAMIGLHAVRDTQCGFKFFTRRAADEIFGRTQIDGYMCDIEILWLAERLGFRIKEVGIQWSDDGDSRLELLRGNVRNMRELVQIRFGRYSLRTAPRPERMVAPLAQLDN
jgi:dolichyl-phosphate beta-glucosyltransferase